MTLAWRAQPHEQVHCCHEARCFQQTLHNPRLQQHTFERVNGLRVQHALVLLSSLSTNLISTLQAATPFIITTAASNTAVGNVGEDEDSIPRLPAQPHCTRGSASSELARVRQKTSTVDTTTTQGWSSPLPTLWLSIAPKTTNCHFRNRTLASGMHIHARQNTSFTAFVAFSSTS